MPDNYDKRDNRDRSRVACAQDHEVQHFAEANGIRVDRARQLIGRHGNDREPLECETRKLRT